MIRFRLGTPSFAIALAVTVFAGQARAQDQAAIEKLVQMNKKALDDYDTLEWDSAKKTLLDALVAGKKAGLDNHPVMARTYVHLGAVYITGFKNRDKALQSFNRALEIDPSIQLSKGIASSDVTDAFNEAKRARGGAGGGGETTPAPKKRRGPVMQSDADVEAPRPGLELVPVVDQPHEILGHPAGDPASPRPVGAISLLYVARHHRVPRRTAADNDCV